ncbi:MULTISPECIES: pyridoxamine 5'-phosphate oxidase family protein [unclassified Thioalkalivibrio]|uniref:pyridoxamine 5'-phosphate oxidase family protein n=1 Tax=unclassified Thioalkalivibrio TaxID=2621013 RepID=UPI00037E5082|nr:MULTISPECIES: pyridoxamine 5'-phosphate oxidase family protein [unclassified Thioalkalivibrio]
MAKTFPELDERLTTFIHEQPVYFVGSAPLAADGHVNLSPKGLDTLRVLGPHRVAYLDLTGSGNETSAHLAENGRITLMFCAFSGKPKILRLYGQGRSVLPSDADWDALNSAFPEHPGTRQIVDVEIHRIQTSCGFGVPEGELRPRATLTEWSERKGPEGLKRYWEEKNAVSIDGLDTPLGKH